MHQLCPIRPNKNAVARATDRGHAEPFRLQEAATTVRGLGVALRDGSRSVTLYDTVAIPAVTNGDDGPF
jgi:hypothetical protein